MSDTYKSFENIRREMADQPLTCPELYVDDYVEIVAEQMLEYLENLGWEYGDELPYIDEDTYWGFWKAAEIDENYSE